MLFDKLRQLGIRLHVLVGNHDIHMRESVDINSPSLVLAEYDNIKVYQQPTTVSIGDTTIDIVPWICRDNQQEIFDFIAKSTSDLCFGHFEITGFQMYKGMESHEGLSTSMFEKYELVCSGHYHTRSQRGNITYVGTPYEMTWQDYNDPKGYHLFDTDSRSLTFVQNPNTIFVKLEYDDTQPLIDLKKIDLQDAFVRVVVVNKTDLYKFDQFMDKLYSKRCYEVKIVEDMSSFHEGGVEGDINLEDTMDVLSNYIDSIDSSMDKEKLKTFMKSLYVQAINAEVM